MNRFALLIVLAAAAAVKLPAACPNNLNVGYQVVTFGSLTASIWYPTTSPGAPYAYSPEITGSVSLNAAPAECGRVPLVVFSHGYGGCATQSVFITEQLARDGYIVAAPNHADAGCTKTPPPPQEPFGQPALWSDQTYIDRRNDIENVIDSLEKSAAFGTVVDTTRVAGMGHSLGGYTIMAMVGGWPTWTDPRIKSALLLSPYVQPFQAKDTVGGVGVPVMYQGGTLDIGITPFVADPGGAYDKTPGTKFFAELQAAGHLVWTNLTCAQAGTVAACLRTVPNAVLIDSYGFAFLDYFVEQHPSPILWGSGAGLADYRHTPPPSVH